MREAIWLSILFTVFSSSSPASDRLNVLCLTSEEHGPHLMKAAL